LELATNLAEQPTISYDLVCTAGDSSVDTPIILEVETTCTGITLHYLAQGGPNANLGYAYTVYQSIPGGTGIPVTTGTLAALEVDERYTVEIPFTRRYPPGTAFYLEVLASSDSIITPVQACTP
jgi:hypothetical protein